MSQELTGLLIGFILTLFIYSYLLGDNPLYRLAVHILVGVSAAYAALVVVRQVIWPVFERIYVEIETGQSATNADSLLWLIPAIFALLLLFKRLPPIAWLGNSTVALLVGTGAAVALTGAVSGTLLPQVTAVDNQAPMQTLIIAILTVSTLFTFQFTGRLNQSGEWIRPFWQRGFVMIGRAVLMITFGALFANVFNTSLILLTDRFNYFLNQFAQLLS